MGLPVDLFQIGFEDAFIQGYIAATIIGLPYLLILFMYVVLFIAIAYNANEFSKFRWVKECVSFFSDKNTNKEAGHLLTEAALKHGMKGVLPLGLTIVFIGIALATLNKVSNHGNKVGMEKLESLAKPPPESVVYVNDNQTIIGSVFF